MNYIESEIRRQDRLLEYSNAIELLRNCEYGVLSMQAGDDGAYGIPVNYVWDDELSIYIHCAPEGRKLRCITSCDRVSFCVVGSTRVIPDKFTTEYESVVLACTAHTHLPEEERRRALSLLIGKYSPEYTETGLQYAEKSFHRTEVIRLDIVSASGKCKRVPEKR